MEKINVSKFRELCMAPLDTLVLYDCEDHTRRKTIYDIADRFNINVDVCLRKMDSVDFTPERLSNISELMKLRKFLMEAIEISKYSDIDEIIFRMKQPPVLKLKTKYYLEYLVFCFLGNGILFFIY